MKSTSKPPASQRHRATSASGRSRRSRSTGFLVVCLLGCAAGILAIAACGPTTDQARAPTAKPETATAPMTTTPTTARKETKAERFLDGRLPIGFYVYLYQWHQASDPAAHDLEDAIEDIARRGFTYLYVGGATATETPAWTKLLALCEQHRIAVIPQLDFAYLASATADVPALVAKAVPFITKYKDHPAVIAFSVAEEPAATTMPLLQRYYEGILRAVPDAPLHLLHTGLPQAVGMTPPYPGIMGTDRYGFWWEMSGHRATPWYALNWYHTQLALFYQETARRGADFQAVFTAHTLEMLATPDQIKTGYYGEGSTGEHAAEARDGFLRRVQDLVAQRNLGWEQGPNGTLRFWKYYRPPLNCVRAMAWLGIMEGARSVSVWSWQQPTEDSKGFAYREHGKVGEEYGNSILGWDGTGTPQLEEYTEFAQQIQRYARLVRSMVKDIAPREGKALPLGHELASDTEGAKALLKVADDDAAWQSFSVPGYAGKVVVLVNTRVGSWCEGRTPRFLAPNDVFRIDDLGNAVDYVPATGPRDLACQVLMHNMECLDLATGKPVAMAGDGSLTLSIAPGAGRFVFLAPKGSGEGTRLAQAYGLP